MASPAIWKKTATVSKWCTNTNQPDLQTFAKIAELLGTGKYLTDHFYKIDYI